MKKIIHHISDLHLRGLQYLDEIDYTFNKLIENIKKTMIEERCAYHSLVVTGDIFHSKLTVTNEYFSSALSIFQKLGDLLPVVIIPGNHDLSLPNKDRLDAITPIWEALYNKTKYEIIYSKHSEIFQVPFVEKGLMHEAIPDSEDVKIFYHHYSILDSKKQWPMKKDYSEGVGIALYHGSINNSQVDSGWTSRGNQDDIEIFKELDAAFLGDIHKHQFLTPTIAYPGSIRQNNFGETLDKGYIVWRIDRDNKISGEFVELPQKRYFITLTAGKPDDIKPPATPTLLNSRVRVKLNKEIDIVEEIKIKNKVEELYKPQGEIECLLPDIIQRVDTRIEIDSDKEILQENIRNIEVQKSLIDKFFSNKDLTEEDFKELYELDKKYHTSIKTDLLRNVKWEIEEIQWDNLFSYGRDNKIDFKKLNGIIGIVGKNGHGKSSIVDVLALTIFNNITKEGANKNFDYINRKSKNGWSKIKISLNGEKYSIERGAKKIGKIEDEKVDNSIDFFKIDKDGNKKLLNGETKPDTNNNIRDIFGNLDDFSVTSLCSQFGLSKFIDARATERKKTISKFFDLDIFEEKYQLAVEHFKDIKSQLKLFDIQSLTKELESNKKNLENLKEKERELENNISKKKIEISNIEEQIFNEAKNIFVLNEKYNKIDLLNKKDLFEKDLINLTNWKRDLEKEIENFQFKGTIQDAGDIKNSYFAKSNKLKVLNAHLADNKQTSELLLKIPGAEICKKCPIAEKAYRAAELIPELTLDIQNVVFSENEKNYKKINTDANDYWAKNNSLKEIERSIDSLKEKILINEEKLKFCQENEECIIKNAEIELKIENLRKEKFNLEKSLTLLENEFKNIEKTININEANSINFSKKIEDVKALSRKNYIYSLYLEAMGKDGIAFWILSKKIPLINNVLNKILNQIWKMKISLENNEEEKTLKIYCQDEGGRRAIELLSGAEKAVCSLALRTAFWYVSSLPKSNILILDESFSFIEKDKIDSVMKALSYLKNFFSNIILITHEDELKLYCDHTLYINKSNGFSKVNE